jgi:BASS family bile acid:Na+ symporter
MEIQQIILAALQIALFASVLTLGFGANKAKPFYLIRRPRLFIRSLLAIYIVVPLVATILLVLVPLPISVKIGMILLTISSVATGSPHTMIRLGANPAYAYSLLMFMSLISIVTVPFSLVILSALPLTHDASVPPLEVVKFIAQSILLPLMVGAIFSRLAPRLTERLSGPINSISGKVLMLGMLSLFALNIGGVVEAGVLSLVVILILTVIALGAGHLLGGPAFGDRAALAIATTQRQMAIATLIAAMNFQNVVIIDAIVIYLIMSTLIVSVYVKWCKRQLVAQTKL